MPVINNPEKQKNLINKNGQYKINFGEDPVNNNQVKYIDRDSYITEEDIARTRPKDGIHLDEEYDTWTPEDLLKEKDDDNNNIKKYLPKESKEGSKTSPSEDKKQIESIKRSKIYQELSGKDLTYEDKKKIVQAHEKIASLKSSIKHIIFGIFEELYHDKSIDMSTIDIKGIWDIVLETRESSPNYVQNILEYLNANKILGCCIKKLKDGQIKEVHKKFKELYRSGSNSKELITQYKEYEEILEILKS